jgi:hypothetical protein
VAGSHLATSRSAPGPGLNRMWAGVPTAAARCAGPELKTEEEFSPRDERRRPAQREPRGVAGAGAGAGHLGRPGGFGGAGAEKRHAAVRPGGGAHERGERAGAQECRRSRESAIVSHHEAPPGQVVRRQPPVGGRAVFFRQPEFGRGVLRAGAQPRGQAQVQAMFAPLLVGGA